MPSHRTTQHHCPQCFNIAKPRCFERGHLVCCPVHNAYRSPYSACVQCEGAARRAERIARKEKEAGGCGGSSCKKKKKRKRSGSEEASAAAGLASGAEAGEGAGSADKSAGSKKSGKSKA
ncbi:hypothetical protein BT67DRAFT_445459 [Trichocladium antarcticum]|uniref:Uncharacterized protein n=1 Tax=Trichocladium antarcticum TaxID=1450529 RepID=A0AAN6UCU7_9PEZI|nr:hypothetical protein BT67DRAFT_445459 [Trichocladium antarcticum]